MMVEALLTVFLLSHTSFFLKKSAWFKSLIFDQIDEIGFDRTCKRMQNENDYITKGDAIV